LNLKNFGSVKIELATSALLHAHQQNQKKTNESASITT